MTPTAQSAFWRANNCDPEFRLPQMIRKPRIYFYQVQYSAEPCELPLPQKRDWTLYLPFYRVLRPVAS